MPGNCLGKPPLYVSIILRTAKYHETLREKMLSKSSPVITAATVVSATLMLFSGCSQQNNTDTANDLVSKVTQASRRDRSVKVAQTMKIPENGSVAAHIATRNIAMAPEVRYQIDRIPENANFTNKGEMLLLGDRVLTRNPPFDSGKGKWKISHEVNHDGNFPSQAQQIRDAGDPSKQFSQVAQGGKVIEDDVGYFDGQRVESYTIRVDISRVVPRLSNLLLRSVLGKASSEGVRWFDYQVSISPQGNLLHARYSIPMRSSSGGEVATGEDRIDSWGDPVILPAISDLDVEF